MSATTNQNKPASKFSLLLHPVKIILPGVITSVIVATISYFFFTGPKQVKGRASSEAWEALQQYEELHTQSMDHAICDATDQSRYAKNTLHVIDATCANLEILKNESNLDTRMLSIINIVYDTYKNMKVETQKMQDSIFYYETAFNKGLLADTDYNAITERIVSDYGSEVTYLKERDNSSIASLFQQLTNIYGEKKFPVHAEQTDEEKRKLIPAKWKLVGSDVLLNFKEDGTASWGGEKLHWNYADNKINLTFDSDQSKMTLIINRISAIAINAEMNVNNKTIMACRQ